MTIKTGNWYRVAATQQYCQVQRIPSTTNPRVSVPSADENTRGFEVALVWYTPKKDAEANRPEMGWTKRVMILEMKKALAVLRSPTDDDDPVLSRLKVSGPGIPVTSAGRDGEFTMPV